MAQYLHVSGCSYLLSHPAKFRSLGFDAVEIFHHLWAPKFEDSTMSSSHAQISHIFAIFLAYFYACSSFLTQRWWHIATESNANVPIFWGKCSRYARKLRSKYGVKWINTQLCSFNSITNISYLKLMHHPLSYFSQDSLLETNIFRQFITTIENTMSHSTYLKTWETNY